MHQLNDCHNRCQQYALSLSKFSRNNNKTHRRLPFNFKNCNWCVYIRLSVFAVRDTRAVTSLIGSIQIVVDLFLRIETKNENEIVGLCCLCRCRCIHNMNDRRISLFFFWHRKIPFKFVMMSRCEHIPHAAHCFCERKKFAVCPADERHALTFAAAFYL